MLHSGSVEFNIVDIKGRTLFTSQSMFGKGKHNYIFNGGSLPAGNYFIRINTNGLSVFDKVILLK